jgi:hypothetical protein
MKITMKIPFLHTARWISNPGTEPKLLDRSQEAFAGTSALGATTVLLACIEAGDFRR